MKGMSHSAAFSRRSPNSSYSSESSVSRSEVMELTPALPLDPLDDHPRWHAATCTHGDESDLLVLALELVERSTNQQRTGGADRVTQRDGTAVDVDLLAVDVEIADELLRHDGEGLVDLEQVDIAQRHAGLGEDLAGGRNGRVQHERGVIAQVRRGADPGPRGQAVRGGVLGACDEQGGRPVHDTRRVARVVHVGDFEAGKLLQDE